MTTDAFDIASCRVGAILNTASGSCGDDAEEKVGSMLAEAGAAHAKVWCGGAEEVDAAFAEAKAHGLDVLVILGGDGTIRTGAEACDGDGPLLLPLPGGTMNMLPKALYGDRSWEEALRDTLRAPRIRTVSGGRAGEKQFFIAGIFGAPALWARSRESIREGDIGGAIEKGVAALQNAFAEQIAYEFDGGKGTAEAVTVICPLISKELSDSRQALEVAVIDVQTATEALGLASLAAFGKWREDGNVTVAESVRIAIRSDRDIPAILDGETMSIGKEVVVKFVPEAFRALVPRE